MQRHLSDDTIRRIYLSPGKQEDIAFRYGTSQGIVSKIKRRSGKRYADVTADLVEPNVNMETK